MPTHQYMQHDWPPALYALMLLAMAITVVVGMCLFLLFATRPQQPHHPQTQERSRLAA